MCHIFIGAKWEVEKKQHFRNFKHIFLSNRRSVFEFILSKIIFNINIILILQNLNFVNIFNVLLYYWLYYIYILDKIY